MLLPVPQPVLLIALYKDSRRNQFCGYVRLCRDTIWFKVMLVPLSQETLTEKGKSEHRDVDAIGLMLSYLQNVIMRLSCISPGGSAPSNTRST